MTDATGQTPTVDVQETDTTQEKEQPKTFDLAYVQQLRQEAASYRVKAKELEDLQAETAEKQALAERERLEKQGEYQALYETANGKLSEFETHNKTLAEQLAETNQVLETLYSKQAETVPDHIKPLLEKMPVTERIDWIAKNQDKLTTGKANGTPARHTQQQRQEVKPAKNHRFRNPL